MMCCEIMVLRLNLLLCVVVLGLLVVLVLLLVYAFVQSCVAAVAFVAVAGPVMHVFIVVASPASEDTSVLKMKHCVSIWVSAVVAG